ncbi:hypothetical protein ISS09_03260, partial [Candidatus Woesearchaeota archaeon]|nr:hypothetical protein [Candidatus Woesearchaeota archaeon]
MKHELSVTLIIIFIFFLTQIFGLFLIQEDISSVEEINGTIVINHGDTSLGERPDTTGFGSFLYLVVAIIVGTALLLLIMYWNKMLVWKIWFFIAIFFAMSIALGVLMNFAIAFLVAFIFSLLKFFKKNIFIHNITEILIYSGLAVLIVPMFDLLWIIILLIVISGYDMYAVWKSKHMVKMAKFQSKSELFAGLMIPYEKKKIHIEMPKKPLVGKTKKRVKNAILGGGDVAFPLIFAGVVMETLIRQGLSLQIAFLQTCIVAVFA